MYEYNECSVSVQSSGFMSLSQVLYPHLLLLSLFGRFSLSFIYPTIFSSNYCSDQFFYS